MPEEKVTNEEIMSFLKDTVATKEDIKDMVTKQDLNVMKAEILDGVDDKLADLKGDLVVLMRREDKKVSELIVTLRDTKVLSAEDAERLLALNPFPQSAS